MSEAMTKRHDIGDRLNLRFRDDRGALQYAVGTVIRGLFREGEPDRYLVDLRLGNAVGPLPSERWVFPFEIVPTEMGR